MIYSYTLPQSHTVFPPCLLCLEYKSNSEASAVSSSAEFNFSTQHFEQSPSNPFLWDLSNPAEIKSTYYPVSAHPCTSSQGDVHKHMEDAIYWFSASWPHYMFIVEATSLEFTEQLWWHNGQLNATPTGSASSCLTSRGLAGFPPVCAVWLVPTKKGEWSSLNAPWRSTHESDHLHLLLLWIKPNPTFNIRTDFPLQKKSSVLKSQFEEKLCVDFQVGLSCNLHVRRSLLELIYCSTHIRLLGKTVKCCFILILEDASKISVQWVKQSFH